MIFPLFRKTGICLGRGALSSGRRGVTFAVVFHGVCLRRVH